MANAPSTNPFVYDRLSFPGYYLHRPCLDTEWLLSTLFDASLLSTSKAAGNGGSFFAVFLTRFPCFVIPGHASSRGPGIQRHASCMDSGFAPKRRAPERPEAGNHKKS